jgi:toxin FitB
MLSQPENLLFLSSITIGESRKGFVLLTQGRRRSELEHWFEHDLVPRFHERILPVTHRIADLWGALAAEAQLRGEPLNTADGLIAATALDHGLTVATRNTTHIAALGVGLFNPWMEASQQGNQAEERL